ncbi:MAG TPA: alpha/beta fold hydrolase [Candidatus Acidoferrales bacterium]|nr:alpha/beta fold hydrolase [Candidatus Acidoferrales bacterium]
MLTFVLPGRRGSSARAQRMAVFSELRYPTTRLAKVLSSLLAIILFAFVSIATISGFLLYQILRTPHPTAAVDLNVMMGHPTTMPFSLADGTSRDGWFFPGRRGAPTVVLCHGYLSQRADVLTLVTALQESQFNVFLFDFSGHGTSPGVTSLGYRERQELKAAVQALSTRDDVDPEHFGLWGVDMGGYAALEEASVDPRISAVAVDDAYSDPREMIQIEVKQSGLAVLPYVGRFCDWGFRLMNYQFRNEPPVNSRLRFTKGIPKLFFQSDSRQALANETLTLFILAPEPKQLVRTRTKYSEMTDDDRKNYENTVVSFFLSSISPTSVSPTSRH